MTPIIEPLHALLLAKLIIAHLLTDFVFQPDAWVKDKTEKRFRSVKLYSHAFIAGLFTFLLIFDRHKWPYAIVIMILHFLIDLVKANITHNADISHNLYKHPNPDQILKKRQFRYFMVDQFAHLISILGVWLFMIKEPLLVWQELVKVTKRQDLWIIILGYILVTYPSAKVISLFTKPWRKDSNHKKPKGIDNAGKYIGIFERILILTFVLLNQFQAIGFLIAAKSILRFRKEGDQEPQKRTEYVLIGTLISLVLAILTGIAVKYSIKHV